MMGQDRNPDLTKGESPSRGEFTSLQVVVASVTLVVLVMVIGFFLDHLASKQATYQTLVERVDENNDKIDNLQEEIKDLNAALGVKKTVEVKLPELIEIRKDFSVSDK